MKGEPLFIPALERLQTLYPGAYTRGATYTYEGAELDPTCLQLSARTHPGAAGLDSLLRGGYPSPTRLS